VKHLFHVQHIQHSNTHSTSSSRKTNPEKQKKPSRKEPKHNSTPQKPRQLPNDLLKKKIGNSSPEDLSDRLHSMVIDTPQPTNDPLKDKLTIPRQSVDPIVQEKQASSSRNSKNQESTTSRPLTILSNLLQNPLAGSNLVKRKLPVYPTMRDLTAKRKASVPESQLTQNH
jgi:hypothetical protein